MNDPLSFIAMFMLKNKHLVHIPEKKEPNQPDPAHNTGPTAAELADQAAEALKQSQIAHPEPVAPTQPAKTGQKPTAGAKKP